MTKTRVEDLDWNNLGFEYHDLPYSWTEEFKDGQWQGGHLTTESTLTLNEAAEVLHYGQEVFEGLKAYRTKDGQVNLFRPDQNAKRMVNSAKRMMMEPYPEEKFLEAVKAVVKGLNPVPFTVSKYDRAAYAGTGQAKTAGNYAGSLLPEMEAKKAGFADCLFLDPREHKYVDEFSGANFFGVTKDGQFVTPKSESILPSVTKRSLLQVAAELGLNPVEKQLEVDHLDDLAEAGAMGTAAVISPVGSLTYKGKKQVFYSETETGPVTTKLYNYLTGVQNGDVEDKFGWVVPVDLD